MSETPNRIADFVHLRVRSAYSMLEGAIQFDVLADLCRRHAMPAVALTDTSNLFGALEFSEKLAGAGIQPIVGLTLAIDPEWPDGPAGAQRGSPRRRRMPRIALLARSADGYANLMRLSSRAFLDHDAASEPHVLPALVGACSDGLICLTGGPEGPVNQAIVDERPDHAEEMLQWLARVFRDRLYVELQRHGLDEEAAAEGPLIDFAYRLDLPLVATNEPYYATPEEFEAHDALLCIAEGVQVGDPDRRQLTPEHWFKSADQMADLFSDLPEAVENTIEIARRCHFRPVTRDPILPSFKGKADTDTDEASELCRQAREGLAARLARHGLAPGATEENYRERLEHELRIITKMNYPGYFLIVADFIKWAKARGIPVGPGRGSGAGSLVSWALTITDLDPLRFGLLFERFLNPERVSMPDFDIDFCQERRDEVIAYVQEKYGREHVAQIITFGKLQARAVLRDVGRVLGLPYGQVDRLCKLVPNNPANPVTLVQAIEQEPRLQEAAAEDEQVARMIEIAKQLEGLYRHASTHAAGVVIGDRPLEQLIPLYRDPRSEMLVTQFNMKWVEKAGLVKFDFLGLKTLTVIEQTVRLLARRGITVDIHNLPLDDERTYRLLQDADTVGVFQLESSGMKDLLRKAQPSNIEDIIALVALYRPGPMENIPKYLAAKHGRETQELLHERLKPIVQDTYGVIIYQEQVMEIARVLSGYSLGEADILRRAMGKKNKEEMKQQMSRFVEGAVERGVERSQAQLIFELVDKFAGYGFNKAHSAAYGLVAYQTAWLKANHPVEFIAASMTLDMANTDKLNVFKREADRLGVKVLPPSINISEADFVVVDGAIRYSLAAIRNVGRSAVEHIMEARREGGPFVSLGDFARRINPRFINRRALECLAKAGTFDELEPDRAAVVAGVERILAMASRAEDDRLAGQNDLFGTGPTARAELELPEVEPWTSMDRLAHEFEAIGFYLSGHPLEEYRPALRRLGIDTWAEFVAKVRGGATAGRLAGTVIHRQERRSRQGNRFAFVGLSDPTGQYEVVVFSDTLATARDLLMPGKAVLLRVDAGLDGDDVKVRIQEVEPLEDAAEQVAAGLRIFLRDDTALPGIAQRLTNGGRAPVNVVVLASGGGREVEISLGHAFTVTPRLKSAIKAVPGVVEVEDI